MEEQLNTLGRRKREIKGQSLDLRRWRSNLDASDRSECEECGPCGNGMLNPRTGSWHCGICEHCSLSDFEHESRHKEIRH